MVDAIQLRRTWGTRFCNWSRRSWRGGGRQRARFTAAALFRTASAMSELPGFRSMRPGAGRGFREDAVVDGEECQLEAVGDTGLVVDAAQVVLDHLFLRTELRGYVLVLAALNDQRHNLHLFWRKPVAYPHANAIGGLHRGHVRALHEALSLGHAANAVHQHRPGDDGDCGYRFQKGAQYIVYTQQETEGRLFATVCNGTRTVSEGRALLPQLRAMRSGQRVASVFGVLRRSDPPFLAPREDPDDPLPKIGLKLRSHYDRFQTTTDGDGVYSFYDVHAGEYAFTANLPARMELTQKTLVGGLPPFKIPNGACYEYNVNALPTGHIQGTVYGPDGKPLKIASLELYRVGSYEDSRPGLWSFQGAKGVFDFDHVGAGEYVIAAIWSAAISAGAWPIPAKHKRLH